MSAVLEAHEPSAKYLSALQPKLVQHFELMGTAPDGVAKLRELILTLAVQGKLVQQDTRDEPASEFLQQVWAEKGRLIDEGRIKKEKVQVKTDTRDKPFGLPVGWEWAKGRELFSVVRGVTYQKADARDTAADKYLPILRANNIRSTINLDDLVYVPSELVSEDQLLRPGDYVVCLASGSKSLVGKVAPFDQSLSCSFGAFCGAIRPFSNPAFFSVYLASPMYRATVSEESAGIGINNLKGSSLLELDIAVPPLAEQARIVTRVEELMRLCDALEAKGKLEAAQHAQLVQTLLGALTASATPDELADNWQRVATHFDLLLDRPEAVDALEQTILQLAVSGLLVPQDPNDEPSSELLKRIRSEKDQLIASGRIKRDKLAEPLTKEVRPDWLPPSWSWLSLSELHPEFQNGASSRGDANGTMVTVLRLADIKNRRISLAETREIPIAAKDIEKYKISIGDILITRVNGSPDIVGQFNLCDADYDAIYCDHFIRMRINGEWMDRLFLALLGESDIVRARIKDLFITTAGQKTVNQGHIGSLQIPLPPLAEQSRIVARVDSLRRLCAELRQRLASLQITKANLADALIDEVA
jgi:type I restriction enzyme S subunit